MGNIKQINIKNYFFNGIINIKDFESSLLKIDKKLYKNTITYSIGYIKIKKDWWLGKWSYCRSFVSDDWENRLMCRRKKLK